MSKNKAVYVLQYNTCQIGSKRVTVWVIFLLEDWDTATTQVSI